MQSIWRNYVMHKIAKVKVCKNNQSIRRIYLWAIFFSLFLVGGKVLLCSSGYIKSLWGVDRPRTQCNPPSSAFWVLGLYVCAIIPSLWATYFLNCLYPTYIKKFKQLYLKSIINHTKIEQRTLIYTSLKTFTGSPGTGKYSQYHSSFKSCQLNPQAKKDKSLEVLMRM